jgi:hypothetical protein
MKKTICHAVFALLLGACMQQATAAGCDFIAPEGWNVAGTRWEGACRDGRADGPGVLKAYESGKVVRFFFGTLKAGEPAIGVIDSEEGYRAGRFTRGRLISNEDRNTLIRAFDSASKAAQALAGRFAKAGNKASARFYEGKARELREQMD